MAGKPPIRNNSAAYTRSGSIDKRVKILKAIGKVISGALKKK